MFRNDFKKCAAILLLLFIRALYCNSHFFHVMFSQDEEDINVYISLMSRPMALDGFKLEEVKYVSRCIIKSVNTLLSLFK